VGVFVCVFVCVSDIVIFVRVHNVATVGDRINVATSSSKFPQSCKKILLEIMFQKNAILSCVAIESSKLIDFFSLCDVFVSNEWKSTHVINVYFSVTNFWFDYRVQPAGSVPHIVC